MPRRVGKGKVERKGEKEERVEVGLGRGLEEMKGRREKRKGDRNRKRRGM
jgi:hypothetical protein